MIALNRNLAGLERSAIRVYTNLANQTPGCVKLTIGEPDFDTPQVIKDAAWDALNRGQTHYAPNQGTADLRRAVAQRETARGNRVTEDQVLITIGACQGLFTALLGILNPGEEVIVPTPGFGLYQTITTIAGGKTVPLDVSKTGFQIDRAALEAAITPRTKAIVLNSPCNPTGVVFSRESMAAVKDAVLGKPIFLICDNVYDQLRYVPQVPDLSLDEQLKDQMILCQSFSKPYAMTGWRIGYLMAPQPVLERLTVLHSHMVTCAPTMLQAACKAALAWDPGEMAACYAQRRAYICRRLADMGLPAQEPKGAFYVFPSVRHLTQDDGELCLRLIRQAKVAAVPGSVFGAPGYLRMSYCCAMDQLEAAMDRLAEFLQNQ